MCRKGDFTSLFNELTMLLLFDLLYDFIVLFFRDWALNMPLALSSVLVGVLF